jgi:hypothetical protein
MFKAVLFCAALTICESKTVTISNLAQRYDTQGNVVNSHDGGLYQFEVGGLYYLYGTVYGMCKQNGPICNGECGYFNNTFSLYTSPDLQTWTLVTSSVVPELEKDNAVVSYWEANVGYCELTKTYVGRR